MEAEDKAKELLRKYWIGINEIAEDSISYRQAKQCALICVEEIINLMVVSFKWDEKTNGNIHFWEEVRDELNKMK